MKTIIISTLLCIAFVPVSAQVFGGSVQDAEKKGIHIRHLDSIYKTAVNPDTTKAVFGNYDSQKEFIKAYTKLLQEFGQFLLKNNFNWERPTPSFDKVYFNSDGTIDYFLYNFASKNMKPEDLLPPQKQKEFDRLLNLFMKDHKLPLKAKTKFSQFSPVTYMPK